MDKNTIVSALIAGKKNIYNCKIKSGRRVFQLGGIGGKTLKVRLNSPKDYPHLELNGFIAWEKWDDFTQAEKDLVMAFYSQLPK